MHIHISSLNHKYSPLSLYSVIYMCVFSADHLILGNQLVCCCRGKLFQLSVVLCIGLKPCRLSPFTFLGPLLSLLSTYLGIHVGDNL